MTQPCISAGKGHTAATKGVKEHKMGSPHAHVAAAALGNSKVQAALNQGTLEAIPIPVASKQCAEGMSKITWMGVPALLQNKGGQRAAGASRTRG